MTIEEMIEEIETHVYSYMPCYGMDDDIGKRIIAALKAGQALSVAAQEVLDVDLYGGYERRLREAVKTWDAATKKEDDK